MGDLGKRLRQERERRQLALDDLATATKIRAPLLEAIEQERWEALPSGIFRRKFLEAYARQLHLDASQVWNEYCLGCGRATEVEMYLPDPRQLHPRPRKHTRARDSKSRRFAIAAVLLTALAVSAWLLPMKVQRQAMFHRIGGFWQGVFGGKNASSSRNPSPPARLAALAGSQAAVGRQTAARRPAAAHPPGVRIRQASAGGLKLQVSVVSAPAWILVHADGREVFSGLLQPRQSRQFAALHRLRLLTGNAGDTRVRVNGKLHPVPGAAGHIANMTFQAEPPGPAAKPAPAQAAR